MPTKRPRQMYYNALVFKFTAKRIRSFGDRNSELLRLPAGNPTSSLTTSSSVVCRIILYSPDHKCNMCAAHNILLRAHSALNTSSATISRYRPTTGSILQTSAAFHFGFILYIIIAAAAAVEVVWTQFYYNILNIYILIHSDIMQHRVAYL